MVINHLFSCPISDGGVGHWVPAYGAQDRSLELAVALLAREMAAFALVHLARWHNLTYRTLEHVLHPFIDARHDRWHEGDWEAHCIIFFQAIDRYTGNCL